MKILTSVLMCFSLLFCAQLNDEMKNYIEELKKEAKEQDSNFIDFDIKRGEKIFTTKSVGKNSLTLSCQSCHGTDLTKEAQNIITGKTLAPLSPSANSSRLSDVKEVQKWLKRNFKDVYLKEGTALEKGDVLYYILNN